VNILITGGIGDFIALESFLSLEYIRGIKKVYLASPRSHLILELMQQLSLWKDKEIIIISWDLTITPQIKDLQHLELVTGQTLPSDVVDLSIAVFFKPSILESYRGSSFLNETFACRDFELPESFILIAPSSTVRERHVGTDILPNEWSNIFSYLEQTDQYAVVVGSFDQDYPIPQHSRLTNLVGKTNIGETIEVLKRSNGFIGVDSFLSVLAVKLFSDDRVLIKSINSFLAFNKKYYYMPRRDYSFINVCVFPFRTSNLLGHYPALKYHALSENGREVHIFNNLAHSICKDIVFQVDYSTLLPYEEDYFNNYVGLKNTAIGNKLNKFRCKIVKKYLKKGKVLDVGIGSGEFIEKIGEGAKGFDVNPYGIKWLQERNLYINPYYDDLEEFSVITLWDTLEHMTNPCCFLSKILPKQFVITTIPVFEDLSRVEYSKHFKINEHLYYWTSDSFRWYMEKNGFEFVKDSEEEQSCGREMVKTFVFRKLEQHTSYSFGQFIEYA
jgi:hypothetical protein